MCTVVLVWRVYRGVAAFGLVNRHDQISECEATVSECDSVRFRATAAKTAQAGPISTQTERMSVEPNCVQTRTLGDGSDEPARQA